MADSLILMVLALVVFGPRRLPQIGRQIGKLMFEFRKASNDFKFQMEEELRLSEEAERRKKEDEQRKQAAQESVSATPVVTKAIEPSNPGETATAAAIGLGVTAPADEPRPDDEVLRVQPPSTGETVAAGGNYESAEPSGSPQSDGTPSTAPSANAPATEAVSRNG
ncbi:MAG TPA: twin-arginine translocase TatA/TatE family subunit [Terracidiphilus sp.]|nr:twin-arginine translocase TatA/TatE family subunit [Terracidiphilus sp.]